MDAKTREEALLREFSELKSWEEKYKYIIRLGRELPGLEEAEKTDDLKVKGCQSQVWLKADLGEKGEILLRADSDALIVKGLIAILLKLYSGLQPADIVMASPEIFDKLGLKSHLSPSRANGLYSMFKQIKYYGLAYQHLSNA